MERELVPYANDLKPVDLENRDPDDLERSLRAYEAGNYLEAQVFLREYRRLFHTHQEVDFFLAQSYIGQDQLERALSILESITGEGDYYAQSLWYRVLILVADGQLEEGMKLLKSFMLIADQHDFKVKEGNQLLGLLTNK